MINITIYTDEKQECVGFNAINHAGYAIAGQDIVCAAVSMMLINTMNAIEQFTDDETLVVSNEDDGLIDYRFDDEPCHDSRLLLNAMILGLKELAYDQNYEDYIKITFKEV